MTDSVTQYTSLKLRPWSRFIATFGGAVVVLIVGVVTLFAIRHATAARELVGHTHQVIETTKAALSDLQNAETGQRGYLLTGDEAYLGPYRIALRALDADTAQLRRLTHDNRSQTARIDSLAPLIKTKVDELRETIATREISGEAAAVAIVATDRGKNAMDAIRAVFGAMETEESRLLDVRRAEEDRRMVWVTIVLVGGTIAAALIALFVNTILSGYAAAQARAAETLAAQNAQLQEQGTELELQQQHLHEQAAELEMQNEQLQQQAVELEAQASELQEQAAALESTNEELEARGEALAARVHDAERASAIAEEAKAQAERLQNSAEIANAAKSEFLAAMSHELRTPLNAITGYVDLLSMGVRGPISESQQEDLRRIKKSGTHLLSLINEILNLARVEAGQVDFNITEVKLAGLLEDVTALVMPQMRSKGLTMTVVPCDPNTVACVDADRTEQILLNLLTNAQKFTDPGGHVWVECLDGDGDGRDGLVRIRIADTGRGIPAEKLTAIFEPFVQIDRRLTPDGQQGVGLGLAISRDLARAMGGDLTAESELGRGSTFSLRLPTGHRAPTSIDETNDETNGTRAAAESRR